MRTAGSSKQDRKVINTTVSSSQDRQELPSALPDESWAILLRILHLYALPPPCPFGEASRLNMNRRTAINNSDLESAERVIEEVQHVVWRDLCRAVAMVLGVQ